MVRARLRQEVPSDQPLLVNALRLNDSANDSLHRFDINNPEFAAPLNLKTIKANPFTTWVNY